MQCVFLIFFLQIGDDFKDVKIIRIYLNLIKKFRISFKFWLNDTKSVIGAMDIHADF